MSDTAGYLIVLGIMLVIPTWTLILIVFSDYYPSPMANRHLPLGLNLIITVCIWLPLTLPVVLLAVLLRLCLPSRIVNTRADVS